MTRTRAGQLDIRAVEAHEHQADSLDGIGDALRAVVSGFADLTTQVRKCREALERIADAVDRNGAGQ